MYDSEQVIEVDLRCPIEFGPQELLGILEAPAEEDLNQAATADVLVCLKCSWCTRTARGRNPKVGRVIHKFAPDGTWVDTFTESS